MSSLGGNFLHLNRDGRWPGFVWRSLEAGSDGALRLTSLPALADRAAARTLEGLPAPDGPAGLAVAAGTVWWTDPKGARLLRRDPCDGAERPVPLDPDARLVEPRGLAVHPARQALMIADAGSHRLLLAALGTGQLAGVWGGPGSTPGLFDRPVGVAVDGEGAVYVVEAGSPRVQKLDLTGVADPGFEAAVAAAAPALARPVAVAVEGERVWVLDAGTRALFAFGLDGTGGDRLDLGPAAPLGLAAVGGALYVGDDASRRLVRVDPADGHTFGEARGFAGPVAALAAAGDGLWVHPGGAASPVRLDREGAAVRQGVLWQQKAQKEPVKLGGVPHAWQRLQALGDPGGGLVTFFVHADAGDGTPSDPDPTRLGDPDGGFGAADWRRIGEGVGDVLVGERSLRLWIGALLVGDGRSGPRIENLRLAFDEEGYAEHLPVIYRLPEKISPQPPPASRETLERFLALFESFFADAEREIADLRRLFDPAIAPAAWLDWLAGWPALDLEEGWQEAKKRRILAGAFAASAWRGTARGLTRALAERLGVRATVEEPHAQTGWWVLAGDGAAGTGGELGVSTRLAPASPQGAVLGSSAVLDASHLIEDEDLGEPLFTGTAYQISVVLPRSQASAPASLEAVRKLIERETPAHTSFQICLVEPGIRIGYQALLGVDTLLGGGPAAASRLGEPAARGLVLAGEPAGRAGASRVGVSARLGEGSVKVQTGAHRPAREEKPWAQ